MFDATLHVLHVRENSFLRSIPSDPRSLDQAAIDHIEQRLTDDDRKTLGARAVLETSDTTADAIVDYARTSGVDLIVMGTHGRTGLDHALVGSVAERVVRLAPCPVLTMRRPAATMVA
jgi:nucleotide-binding universal stress UspA family protein